jgi:hypothetical protein
MKWRSRIALMGGKCLVGISAANRKASGIALGDTVEIEFALDTEPRTVAEPADVALALNKSARVRAAFDKLPFGLRRKRIADIENAKSPETRKRRIEKLLADLRAGR